MPHLVRLGECLHADAMMTGDRLKFRLDVTKYESILRPIGANVTCEPDM